MPTSKKCWPIYKGLRDRRAAFREDPGAGHPGANKRGWTVILEEMLGKVVYSKSGRDQGRIFIIVGIIDDRLVRLADGDLRKIEKPKVKNIKHLQFTGMKAEEIIAVMKSGETPGNHILRKYLRKAVSTGLSSGKEVW